MQASEAKVQTSGRWWWMAGFGVAAAVAAYAGWDWLVATGLAAVVVAVGPCVAMCALGLCMRHGKEKEPAPLAQIGKTYEPPNRS
ncbi:MAG: hypothetical protein ACT4P3_15455 [Betaproteobacteria bacterium]